MRFSRTGLRSETRCRNPGYSGQCYGPQGGWRGGSGPACPAHVSCEGCIPPSPPSPRGAFPPSEYSEVIRLPMDHGPSSRYGLPGTCKAARTPAGLLAPGPPPLWHTGGGTPGQPAGTGPAVLASCAPPLRRGALTNQRLVQRADGPETCRVQERTRPAWTPRSLPAEACMRRFLPHVRPTGCRTVRSDGIRRPRRRPARAPRMSVRYALALNPSTWGSLW